MVWGFFLEHLSQVGVVGKWGAEVAHAAVMGSLWVGCQPVRTWPRGRSADGGPVEAPAKPVWCGTFCGPGSPGELSGFQSTALPTPDEGGWSAHASGRTRGKASWEPHPVPAAYPVSEDSMLWRWSVALHWAAWLCTGTRGCPPCRCAVGRARLVSASPAWLGCQPPGLALERTALWRCE